MSNRVFIMSFAAVLCAGVAFSDTISWKNAVSGSWDDPAMWDLARTPRDGDAVRVNTTGEFTVALPDEDVSFMPQSVRFYAPNGSALTIDGRGGSFTMPDCATNHYANEPWGINASKGHLFNIETYNIADAKKHAVVAMTNAYLTVSCVNHEARLDVMDGFLNFYDPVGVAYSHPFILGAYNQSDLQIHVHSNAHLRLPTVKFRANASGVNLFAFHGGKSEICKSFYVPSENFSAAIKSTGKLLATDGAELYIGSIGIGGVISGNTSSNRTAVVAVENGSEIVVGGSVGQSNAGMFNVDVSGGSTFACSNGCNFANAAYSTSVVSVADSTFVGSGAVTLGSSSDTSYAWMTATNSTISLMSDLQVGNGIFLAKDTASTISFLYPGYHGGSGTYGEAIFDGGTLALGTMFCGLNRAGSVTFRNGVQVTATGGSYIVAKDAGTRGVMTVEDDATYISAKAGFIGYYGFGTLNMKAGTLSMASHGLQLGYYASATGIVEQTGGDVIATGSEGLVVGFSGYGEYNISGGTITTFQIREGMGSRLEGPTNVLRITGGLVSVTTTDGSRGVNVCDATGSLCSLVLEGGVLQSHRVRGWTGATAKGGGGWAVLEGDGGTIRAHVSSPGFVENFDEAKLGDKGLTLDSAHPVTIAQNFTDKDGEAGRLILTGAGVKTLTGTNSRESVLEIAGGTTLFASGASHHSSLVVTNSAILSFVGDSTGGTFKGIALGSASSIGFIALDLADRLVLESVPTFGNFGLMIEDESYSAGTYTIMTCPGEVSSAVAAAWGGGYIYNGRLDGMAYTFATAYDSSEDVTSFNLVVTEGGGVSGSSVWAGPGSDWADAANWDATLPGSTSAAVFSSESAPSPVNVADDVTVGALDFSAAKSYSLAGSGTISLSDTGSARVSASGGDVDIGVGLKLPTIVEFDVTNSASLTLSGAVNRGGIVKSGTGRLFLESEDNSLLAGLRVSNGLLSLSSIAACGMADSAFRQLTIDGGTFELRSGASGELPFSIVVQADSQEAVGIKNDADVTVSSATVNSGDIIKLGEGTLTFSGSSTLSTDNGKCTVNETPSSARQYFPSNGVMPTAGYSGFNVADGEVVFKNGTYTIPNAISVGLATLDVSDSEPAFTVDGATVNTGMGSYHFLLGANAFSNQAKFTRPRLTVKNGGYLSVNTLNVGKQGNYALYPEVVLDNGTIYASWSLNISERPGCQATYVITNGSRFLSNVEVNWRGPADLTFIDSVFAKNASLDLQSMLITGGGSGTWLFGEGATFYCSGITHKVQTYVTFAFDGGRWVASKFGDYNFLYAHADRMTFDVRSEKGLHLAPGSGCEWRMAKAVTGTGGVVLDGAGTLRFVTQEIVQNGATNKIGAAGTDAVITSPYTLDFDGPMDIASGTVVVEEGAARTNAVFTGAGTLTATNCVSPVFKLSVSDEYVAERVLTLDGFTSVGSVVVDLGRTSANPLKRPFSEMVVAHYAGDAPDVSAWKARGTGLPMVTGSCRAENGDVIMTLRTAGSVLIFK